MPEYLYIHIPFCIKKCIYCDFLSIPFDESLAKGYVDALCKELILKKNLADTLKTVYIGGGTPSLLSVECLKKLFTCLEDNFKFYPIEITVEANPGTLDESRMDNLVSLGANRLSLGVQSFDDNELKTLGRIHTSEEAVRAIEIIKNAGLRNFSMDLMYGIPGQTMATWKETLNKAVSFSPTHISSYELTPEKGTPLYELIESTPPPHPPLAKGGYRGASDTGMGRLRQVAEERGFSDKIKMPDEELVLEMYSSAIDYFLSHGYDHYEISNFALSGYQCLHNLNYWDRGEYIGAGAGAHSFINETRSKNTGDIHTYIEKLNRGIIPEIESTKLPRADVIREFIFLGLRKTEGISLIKAKEFGISLHDSCEELINEGYLEIKGDYLRLTRKGLVISNTIIVRIFEGLRL